MACNFAGLKNIRRISVLRLTVALRSSKIRGLIFGGVPERSKGADCKSAGSTFGGSNPPPSTIRYIVVQARLTNFAAGVLSQIGRVWTDKRFSKIAG